MATDVVEDPDKTEQGQRRRRRRRNSKRDEPESDWLGMLRSPRFGQAVFAVMALLAIALLWRQYGQVSASAGRLGPLTLGMDRLELQTKLGQGSEVPGQPGQVRYSAEGRTFQVTIDPASGRVTTITCTETDLTALPCPGQLGIRVGDGRDRVIRKLGPGDQAGSGGAELRYPALSTGLRLVDDRVVEIKVAKVGEEASIWPIVLWRLLP